ncbi:MAG: hypothetical protein IH899_21205, partial [Planctomycetes bacterium]|nr:hypothetical protein [Planctomycetota bacterium]
MKKQILKQGALRPKSIRKYWAGGWGADRPPNPVALDKLYSDGFSDAGAANFLKVYDATIAYAGLAESDKMSPVDDIARKEDDDLNLQRVTPKVGDYVQWTSSGSDQFRIPRCVTWV